MTNTARETQMAHRRLAAAAVLALSLAGIACTPTQDTRGAMPDPSVVAELIPGATTRDKVIEVLGSPSATATFEKETWYYIGKKTETLAFFTPKVVEQRVVALHFDASGVLQEVETFDGTTARDVNLVDRETPTKGKELTIIQQMLGNVGRFNTNPESGGL